MLSCIRNFLSYFKIELYPWLFCVSVCEIINAVPCTGDQVYYIQCIFLALI